MECVVRSPITHQPGHANGIRIVMLQPLLPAKGIANGGLQLARQFKHFVATFSATVPTKDRHRFRFIDHPHQLFEVCIGRSQNSWGCNGEVGRLVRSIGGRDIARYGENGGTLFQNSCEDGGVDDRAGLLRVDQSRGIERSRLEKLVRIQFLERRCVNNARLYIPGDGDNGSCFFPRVHQSVEQMDNSGPRSSAHHHWITREISLRDRCEYSIFLMTNGNKLDCAISAQCVHYRIQSVSDDSITAFDTSLRQHLPQYVCDFFRHKNLPDFLVDLILVPRRAIHSQRLRCRYPYPAALEQSCISVFTSLGPCNCRAMKFTATNHASCTSGQGSFLQLRDKPDDT